MRMIVFIINLLKPLKWTSHPLVDLGNKLFFHLFHEIENSMCDELVVGKAGCLENIAC